MKSDNKITGNRGEELACEYLEKKGFLVVERNFSTRYGELDIICLDGEILVFVEVKTKVGHDFGEPEEMVSKSKLGQVQRMGEVFIEMNNFSSFGSGLSDFSTLPAGRQVGIAPSTGASLRQNRTTPAPPGKITRLQKWNGGCRVDVVGIVLKDNGEVERIKHYEAVY